MIDRTALEISAVQSQVNSALVETSCKLVGV